MLRGDFQSAWRESDAIRARTPEDPQRFWSGENLQGRRIILRCLHGFGDAVQFLCFAPRLRAIASELIVEVPPKLLELAPMLDGVGHVITWGERAPAIAPEWDVQVEINELTHLFRLDLSELPVATKYLRVPARHTTLYSAMPNEAGSLKVGVVWAGGEWNAARSIPFHEFAPILEVTGCEFWNLQGGKARSSWPSGLRHLHAAEQCEDSIVALAAVIAQMDLVITADTLAAHLAGAQGVPCWVILQHAADWRWMHGRDDSPWYPSLRLFRRSRSEGWSEVVASVASRLQDLACQRRTEQEATTASSS